MDKQEKLLIFVLGAIFGFISVSIFDVPVYVATIMSFFLADILSAEIRIRLLEYEIKQMKGKQ